MLKALQQILCARGVLHHNQRIRGHSFTSAGGRRALIVYRRTQAGPFRTLASPTLGGSVAVSAGQPEQMPIDSDCDAELSMPQLAVKQQSCFLSCSLLRIKQWRVAGGARANRNLAGSTQGALPERREHLLLPALDHHKFCAVHKLHRLQALLQHCSAASPADLNYDAVAVPARP